MNRSRSTPLILLLLTLIAVVVLGKGCYFSVMNTLVFAQSEQQVGTKNARMNQTAKLVIPTPTPWATETPMIFPTVANYLEIASNDLAVNLDGVMFNAVIAPAELRDDFEPKQVEATSQPELQLTTQPVTDKAKGNVSCKLANFGYPCPKGEAFFTTGYTFSPQHAGIDGKCTIGGKTLKWDKHIVMGAVADGVVVRRYENFGYGRTAEDQDTFKFTISGQVLKIETKNCGPEGQSCFTWYGHMKEMFVEQGQIVKKGDPLGVIGATGNSIGEHLHYDVCIEYGNDLVCIDPTQTFNNPNSECGS
jgi:hypothetical protein